MISLTFDTEWSPKEVLSYTLDLVNQYGIHTTWFCTDERVKSCINGVHELAIHPHFKSRGTEMATLTRLLRMYPDAKGSRSHSVYFHTRLTDLYKKFGIEYDCNFVIPRRVKPWWLLNGILEIPVNYPDNYMFIQNNWFPIEELDDSHDLTVFSFHPVHVYLNTESQGHYESVKLFYQDAEKLRVRRNDQTRGVEDYLQELLERIRKNDLGTCTLRQVNDAVRDKVEEWR